MSFSYPSREANLTKMKTEMIEKKSNKDEHEQLQGVGNFTRREDTEVKIGQVDGKVERRHAGDAEAQDKSTGQQSRCAVSVPYI